MKKWLIPLMIIVMLAVSAGMTAAGEEAAGISAGDTVTFGRFPQAKNGNDLTPIEWLVLDVQEGKALLISKYGLAMRSFSQLHSDKPDMYWDVSQLRTWLNDAFYGSAFSPEEQAAILAATVENKKISFFNEGEDKPETEDKLFVLSYAEANRYLGVIPGGNDIRARSAPTPCAIARGAWTSETDRTADGEPAGHWWLRSANGFGTAAVVDGSGGLIGYDIFRGGVMVRPAVWINPESEIFRSENP